MSGESAGWACNEPAKVMKSANTTHLVILSAAKDLMEAAMRSFAALGTT
jgi:hypothetical protein